MAQSHLFYASFLLTALLIVHTSAAYSVPGGGSAPADLTPIKARKSSKITYTKDELPEVPRMKLARTNNIDYEKATTAAARWSFGIPKFVHPFANHSEPGRSALLAVNQVNKVWILPVGILSHSIVVVPKNRRIYLYGFGSCQGNDYDTMGRNMSEIKTDKRNIADIWADYNSYSTFESVSINGVNLGAGIKTFTKKSFTWKWPADNIFDIPGIATTRRAYCVHNGVLIEKAAPGVHLMHITDPQYPGETGNITLVISPVM